MMSLIKVTDYKDTNIHYISIRKNGYIFIRQCTLYLLDFGPSHKYVDIFIDKEFKKLVIKLKTEKTSKRIVTEGSGISINISPILGMLKIENSKMYRLPCNFEGDLLMIDLSTVL